MSSLPPNRLILLLAAASAVAVGQMGGGGGAWAQPVSSARFVPSPAVQQVQARAPGSQTAFPQTSEKAHQPSTPAASGTAAAQVAPVATGLAATGVGGRVVGNASPLPAAGVYAYQLASLTLKKVETDPQGNFLFRDLPAGLYKIIAHKAGFMPVVILLTRTTAQAYQFLELQLAQREVAAPGTSPASGADRGAGKRGGTSGTGGGKQATGTPEELDFWTLRASIPADVLREIETSEAPGSAAAADTPSRAAQPAAAGGAGSQVPTAKAASALSAGPLDGRFRTEVLAMTGVAAVPQVGVGQVSTGKLGIEGKLGQVQLGLSGRFWQMTSDGPVPGMPRSLSGVSSDGQTSALSLDVQAGQSSKITVDSLTNHLMPRGSVATSTAAGLPGRVGLDHYQVSWSQALGEGSHSDFAAQYTSENNYHRQGAIDPVDIPDASRTWRVEGAYTTATGDSGSLQAGFRYSELQLGAGSPGVNLAAGSPLAGFSTLPALSTPGAATSAATGTAISPGHQTVDFFTRGSERLRPAFMVEYGLYTTLQDGSLSLTPQVGLVLQLGDGWQASGSASHRVYQQNSFDPEFLPTLFKESDLCQQGGRACYELSLANHSENGGLVSFSAIERIVGQTLRLYFSDVIFDRLESLYLVPGDRLPEMHFVATRRLTPQVRTSLESSFATGGGGTFIAADGRPYRNQVRYMVTSLDTRFLNTATGVFLAVHHLTQDLAPLAGLPVPGTSTAVSFDRLQLMLSQDLNFLFNLASAWTVQVNMELSRGEAPYLASADTQLHRRILGGIAVKF